MKIIKLKIRVAQNVGKVWISRTKVLTLSHAISGIFFHGPESCQKVYWSIFFCIFLGGPMGPIHPVWADALLSNIGGQLVGCGLLVSFAG